MKKISVLVSTGGIASFLLEDDQADELKKKVEAGVGNLTSFTKDSYTWMNVRHVVQISIHEYIEPSEKEEDSEESPKT